tara:strand:- start:2818 stop:3315 length:498 start_codon:yes stop_codon:yes gene_type:complete
MNQNTKKMKEKHSKHYYEFGRNGWTPTSTSENQSKEKTREKTDLKNYVKELEKYVQDMEMYIHGTENKCNVESCEQPNVKKDEFASLLDSTAKEITDLLKRKNIDYGNTALNPPRIFSKLNASEALCARLDDKLSRIKNRGINDKTEDTLDDVIGYLLLLKMSLK